MISIDDFFRAHEEALGFLPDAEKLDAIKAPPQATLFLVAGPGTGKTACLATRVLKLMLVDGVPADGIVATTFTVKAAAELRSRILDWGFKLTHQLAADGGLSEEQRAAANRLDVNQIVTGTLDSLCQDMLVRYRDPGTQPPVLIDEFVSKTLLLRHGMFGDGRFRSARLDALLFRLAGRSSRFGWHLGTKTEVLSAAADRLIHDQVDLKKYARSRKADEKYAREKMLVAIDDYASALDERMMLDYARLEAEALERLQAGELSNFLQRVRVVLVDEYQDTNLLQERLYFELARACKGAFTVVGDDDQSLFRFRGATVELFNAFPDRAAQAGWKAKTVFLQTNHRSTKTIVEFVDQYATLDPGYQLVRAKDKPALAASRTVATGLPILGMFRQSTIELATDLAAFLKAIFFGRGYRLPNTDRILPGHPGGAVGDAALLCSSPREAGANGAALLPGLLRAALQQEPHVVGMFNPRGAALQDIHEVQALGGTLLECLDPDGRIESAIFLPQETRMMFGQWRATARADTPNRGKHAAKLLRGWRGRDRNRAWPQRTSALEMLYSFAHFFPELHDDPEGQVYLEAFARQLSACEQVSSFSGRVLNDPHGVRDSKGLNLADRSVAALLSDFLGPIAAGSVDVNEDLFEDFPRDRLSVLSIHQAKGLEFPLTIVDVGSSFKTNHSAHRFKRFPDRGGAPQAMEDDFRPYTPLSAPTRSGVDRAFDDLYRQYFVAFSRARDVLLLVGLDATLPGGNVENVATGWRRDGTCPWASQSPFEMI